MKNKLKIARVTVDLTQQQLADKVGVSRQTINALETGKYVASTLLALKIAYILKSKVDELFILEETDW